MSKLRRIFLGRTRGSHDRDQFKAAVDELERAKVTYTPGGFQREVMLTGKLVIEEIDDETGLVTRTEEYNVLTDAFRAAVASLIIGGTNKPTQIKLGTGSTGDWENGSAHYTNDTPFTSSGGLDTRFSQSVANTGATRRISRAMFYLKRTGTPGGTISVAITAVDGGSLPTGAILHQSSVVAIDGISTTIDWVAFPFSTQPQFLTGTTWAFQLIPSAGYTHSAGVNQLALGYDNTPVFSGGLMGRFDDSDDSWSGFGAPARDAIFRLVSEPDANFTNIDGGVAGGTKNFTSQTNPSPNQARLLANFTGTEGNGYLGHAGMFDAADVLHAIVGVNHNKISGRSINAYWVIGVN